MRKVMTCHRWPMLNWLLLTVVALACLAISDARADLIGHGGMVRSVTTSADGSMVLTTSFDYSAKVWSFSDQEPIASLDAHDGPVNAGLFLNDTTAVTVGDDGKLVFWDLTTGDVSRAIDAHNHKIMALAVSKDGSKIATGSWDKTITLWDAKSGQELRTIKIKTPINALAFIGDGTVIAAGGHDGAIHLVRVSDGISLGTLSGHRMAVTGLTASSDGKRLLSSSIDQTVRHWDVASGEVLAIFEGHDGQVFSVIYGPDQQTAITVGRDGFLIIWDIQSSQIIKTIPAHNAIAWSVAITPDGRFAITGGGDESARVWHLATGDRIGISAEDQSGRPEPWETSNHPGADVYRSCAKCHAITAAEPQRSGPHFEGVFGRKVGTVDGYNYSAALRNAEFDWDDETLFQLFDLGPDKFLPGTKMPVQRVTDAEKLRDLIDYLRKLTDPSSNTAQTPD